MTKILLIILLLGSSAVASDTATLIGEAREKLDHAARHFSELHARFIEDEEDRAFLGVLIGKGDESGVHLIGVTPGSGAEQAGLRSGDLVTGIAGVSLVSVSDPATKLIETMDKVLPGDVVVIDAMREGESHTFNVQASQHGIGMVAKMIHDKDFNWTTSDFHMPEDINVDGIARSISMFASPAGGLMLVDVDEALGAYFGVTEGVLVVKGQDGLMGGDVLQSIGGEAVESAGEAYRALRHLGEATDVDVIRQHGLVTVSVEPVSYQSMPGAHKVIKLRHIRRGGDEANEVQVDDDTTVFVEDM